jgi:ESS family glutamate:Na+ symporter
MEPLVIKLDMIQMLAAAAVVLFIGHGIKQIAPVFDKYSIPAAVVGGLLFALVALILRENDLVQFSFDNALQTPMMIAFFTTIGLGANLKLLKVGGVQVVIFLLLASLLAVFQNVIGVLVTYPLGTHPFLGLLGGSISLIGGLGTSAAFGKLMEDSYGFVGGVPLGVAASTFGLMTGGLIAGPVVLALIKRYNPVHKADSMGADTDRIAKELATFEGDIETEPTGEDPTAFRMLKTITVILVAMFLGGLLSGWLGKYITLPAYIGSMVVAGVLCNLLPLAKIHLEGRVVDDLSTIFLSLFLTMALMSLKIWEIANLALPMLIILIVQIIFMSAYAYYFCFRFMGKDYDAAVMSGGLIGFALGATSNAMASMQAIAERHGPAPRAFLIVPIVGAFFVDFTNALIITGFLNFLK